VIWRKGRDVLAHGGTRPRIAPLEQPEISKWTIILLLVHHPLFYFDQTLVGPFDFLQTFALRVDFVRSERVDAQDSQDVLTKAQ
jgi:hypothetical protein